MNKYLKIFLSLLMLMLLNGCVTKKVIIPPSGIVRLGPDVYGTVGYYDESKHWVMTKNRVHLPEGWVAHDLKQ